VLALGSWSTTARRCEVEPLGARRPNRRSPRTAFERPSNGLPNRKPNRSAVQPAPRRTAVVLKRLGPRVARGGGRASVMASANEGGCCGTEHCGAVGGGGMRVGLAWQIVGAAQGRDGGEDRVVDDAQPSLHERHSGRRSPTLGWLSEPDRTALNFALYGRRRPAKTQGCTAVSPRYHGGSQIE
jgi:hypothetical protein